MANKPDVSYRSFPGEFNAYNPSEIPQGAAQTILNGVIRNQGVIEPIRGYTTPSYPLPIAPQTIGVMDVSRVFMGTTQDSSTTNTGAAPAANAVLYYLDSVGAFNSQILSRAFGWDMGIPAPSPNYLPSFFAAQRQGWLMTGRGLMKVERQNDNLNGTGTVPNLIPTELPTVSTTNVEFTSASAFGSGGWPGQTTSAYVGLGSAPAAQQWLASNFGVAYRFLVCRKDPVTGQVRYGEPSGRVLYYNTTGSAQGTAVIIPNPNNCPPDAFLQIYRSFSQPIANTPSDEMYLVAELPLGTFNGTNYWGFAKNNTSGFSTYQDVTPDSQIYVPLYTNRGLGNGIQASKFPAPQANVSGYFQGRAYYGDTNSQQSLLIYLAGTDTAGGGFGLQQGDSITVDGVVYTAINSNDSTTHNALQFPIVSPSGTFTYNPQGISTAIRLTGQMLAATINNYYRNVNPGLPLDRQIQADYISTGAGDEGQILLRRPRPGSPAFTVTTSANRGWAQNYTGGVTSNPAAAPAGITFSDLNQPDSCPLANGPNIIGNPNSRVLGFVALRDFAIIFKEDGAFTVRETTRGPQFSPLDSTVRLVAPRTAVAVGNECFALTAQGVVRIGEFGVENISQPIQREILGYLQRSQGLFQGAFAVGYEAEREYWLALPSSQTIAQADLVKIYNGKTQAWTTAKHGNLTAGAEIPTSASTARVATTALAFGVNGGYGSLTNPNYVGWLKENKSQSNADFIQATITPHFTVGLTPGTGTATLTFDDTRWFNLIGPGTLIRMPNNASQQTFIVQTTGYFNTPGFWFATVNLNAGATINNTTGTYTQPAIVTTIKFMPEDAGYPLLDKKWDGIYLWHRYWNGGFMSTGWSTEKTPFPIFGTEAGPGTSSMATWGYRPWNSTPWQCPAQDYVLSTSLSPDDIRSGVLTPTFIYYNALTRFELSAVTFNVASVSDRIIIS